MPEHLIQPVMSNSFKSFFLVGYDHHLKIVFVGVVGQCVDDPPEWPHYAVPPFIGWTGSEGASVQVCKGQPNVISTSTATSGRLRHAQLVFN